MDAAVKIFAEKGFSAATLEEIAGEAEFGKGTLYNYFNGKEEIYSALIEDVLNFNIELVKRVDSESENAKMFLESYTKGFLNYCLQNSSSFLLFVREIAHLNTDYLIADRSLMIAKYEQIRTTFVDRIKKGIADKEIKNYDPLKLAAFYDHFIFSYMHFMVSCPKFKFEDAEEATFLLSILFDGLLMKNEDK